MASAVDLKEMVYETIGEVYRKLKSLGVEVRDDYTSVLPSVERTEGDPGYNPEKNIVYINPDSEELKDNLVAEAMHFLHCATQGIIGRKPLWKYAHIDECVAGMGRLLMGTSDHVGLPKPLLRMLRDFKKMKEGTEEDSPSYYLLLEIMCRDLETHKIGYELAEGVRRYGLERFFRENPDFLRESYEEKERDVKRFVKHSARANIRSRFARRKR